MPCRLTRGKLTGGVGARAGLAKTQDGTSVVYTTLSMPGADGRRLASFNFALTLLEHVRHLDISNNKFISEISESVGQMELLLSLKASGNRIASFDVPNGLAFLQSVDLSNNQLGAWDALEAPHLRYLNLCDNELTAVRGLEQNTELQTLLLANQSKTEGEEMTKTLTSCDGLGLTTLRELSLTNCGLESLEGFKSLKLPALDLTGNSLKDLRGLSTAGVLKTLVLEGNPIESLDAVDALADVGLAELRLPEIPEAPAEWRVLVIQKLAKKDAGGALSFTLEKLNDQLITDEEKDQVMEQCPLMTCVSTPQSLQTRVWRGG